MIEVRELVKRYGGRLAVDGLSFTVESGQVYGFLGPNGAGKSTTMNMMTGYLGPTAGEVLVDGHSVADEPEEAKRRIGYLPEQPPLYTEMTVDEYLEFAAALKKVPRADRARQVDRAVERTRLGEVRRRLIRNLSKGYRQRVGIAQALLGDPEIIILDEPTVGLDPKQIIEIRALIRALAAEHTVILSSHILAEVQAVCGQILIIHRGRMVASGAPAELERRLAGSQALDVVVKGEEAAGRALLSALPGVRSVESVPDAEPGTAGFRVEPRAGEDLREAVFRACAAAELPLLGLRSGGLTLEEIFLKLTADEEAVTENGPSGGGSGGDGEIPAAEDAADGEEEEA